MQTSLAPVKFSSTTAVPRAAFAGLMILTVAGCTGEIGGDRGPAPPPDVVPQVVPQDLAAVEGQGFCVSLGAGEVLRSVSPEGHAWLVTDKPGMSSLRVLDAFDATKELARDIELSNIRRLQAWSQTDAAVITDDGLWRLEDLARVQLSPPQGFSSDAGLCGDPGSNGALLCSGKLFERRDDDQWWAFAPGASGDGAPSELVSQQGECQGGDDSSWMTSPDGTLWRLLSANVHRPVKFDALKSAAITTLPGSYADVLLGVIDGERVWIGPSAWRAWTFESGAPDQLAAAGGKVWLTAGSQLLRFDGTEWEAITPPTGASGSVTAVMAHAGGAWLTRGTSVCHVATDPMLRVSGIRPFSRSKEFEYQFSLATNDPSASVSASLDGKALVLASDPTSGAATGAVRLDELGWHELLVSTNAVSRSILVKRLPEYERSWQTDIRPLYEKHCSGADCHTAENSEGGPALSGYDDWVKYAKQIRTRVVDAGTMPPEKNRSAGFSDADVQVIAQWLAGGMAP